MANFRGLFACLMVALSLPALMWFTARSAIEAAQMGWDDRTGDDR